MKTASERGRSNRRKGGDFEREFCRWVRDELGIEFGRNLAQWAKAGEGDTDPLGPFLPECKNCARLNVKAWWHQTVAQAKKRGLWPLLVYKIPRKGWRAVIPCGVLNELTHGSAWTYDYEYTADISPAMLALIVREAL